MNAEDELDYALQLIRSTRLRALVLDGKHDGHGLYLLRKDGSCQQAAADLLTAVLPPGDYSLRVHARQPSAAGEYALLLVECDPGDARCDG